MIIIDFNNFPGNFDKFPAMEDLSAEEQEYINKNGVAKYAEMYPSSTTTINGTKISKKFLSAFHINWLVDLIKSLFTEFKTLTTNFSNLTTNFNTLKTTFNKMWVNCGTYDTATAYTIGNYVEYNGLTYLCINNCKNIPPTDTSYWRKLSGSNGTPSTYYYLDVPYQAIIQNDVNTLTPSQLTVSSYQIIGSTINAYLCNFEVYWKGRGENASWNLATTKNSSTIFDIALDDNGTGTGTFSEMEALKIRMLDTTNGKVLCERIIPILCLYNIDGNLSSNAVTTNNMYIVKTGADGKTYLIKTNTQDGRIDFVTKVNGIDSIMRIEDINGGLVSIDGELHIDGNYLAHVGDTYIEDGEIRRGRDTNTSPIVIKLESTGKYKLLVKQNEIFNCTLEKTKLRHSANSNLVLGDDGIKANGSFKLNDAITNTNMIKNGYTNADTEFVSSKPLEELIADLNNRIKALESKQ